MHTSTKPLILLVLALSTSLESQAMGQQTLVSLPNQRINDGFYENVGIGGFGFNRAGANGNAFFNRGPLAAPPPFGGFDPGSGASLGIGGSGGGGLNFYAGQGSSRSIVSETPMVMVPNGGSASFFSGSVRPFVTGIVPVVGGRPTFISPVQQAMQRMQQAPPPTPSTTVEPTQATAISAATAKPSGEQALVIRAAASQQPAMRTPAAPGGSLSELRRQREAEVAAQREEARQKIIAARQAESEGNGHWLAVNIVSQCVCLLTTTHGARRLLSG